MAMTMIDVREDLLNVIKDILAKHVPDYEVRAFGSRVNWTARDASDLDLVVVGKEKLHWKVMAKLKVAFDDSKIPFRVDVLDWHAIPENFRGNIGKKFEVVQEGKATKEGFKKVIENQAVTIVGESELFEDCPLNEIAELEMGQSPPGSSCNEQGKGLPLLNGPTEFGSHHPSPVQYTTEPKKLSKPGDLLFCVRGSTTGRMNWSDREYAIGHGIAALRHRSGHAYQPFLRAVIENKLPTLLASATGSTFPNVSRQQIFDLRIKCPELDTQRAIAHILGTLDDKIEINRKMNQTLEEIARALYKSWFVDFDPVKKKAAGESTGLPEEIDRLFPNEFEESEMGRVPKGWKNEAVSAILDISPSVPLRKGEIAKCAEMSNLPTEGFLVNNTSMKPYNGGAKFAKNDVLLARITPCLENGKTAIAHFLDSNEVGFGSTEFIVLRGRKNVGYHFVYCLARDATFRSHCIASMIGSSGRQRVQNVCFDNYKIAIPLADILLAFSRVAEPLFQDIVTGGDSAESLSNIRDTLLPLLLSGKLPIKDAEKFLVKAGV